MRWQEVLLLLVENLKNYSPEPILKTRNNCSLEEHEYQRIESNWRNNQIRDFQKNTAEFRLKKTIIENKFRITNCCFCDKFSNACLVSKGRPKYWGKQNDIFLK